MLNFYFNFFIIHLYFNVTRTQYFFKFKFMPLRLSKLMYRQIFKRVLSLCTEERTENLGKSKRGISEPARDDDPRCRSMSYNSLVIRHDLNLQSLQATLLITLQRCTRMHLDMHSVYAIVFKMCSIHDKNLELTWPFLVDTTALHPFDAYIYIYIFSRN